LIHDQRRHVVQVVNLRLVHGPWFAVDDTERAEVMPVARLQWDTRLEAQADFACDERIGE
jgi:hypothetical protein